MGSLRSTKLANLFMDFYGQICFSFVINFFTADISMVLFVFLILNKMQMSFLTVFRTIQEDEEQPPYIMY